ncbi:MAG: hypothetical protein L3J07_00325 [Candidatus Magasanikbacteria bacterium]|nr:hypothetical protein [Candidatus Magasanikbacteria bacterium]
MKNKKIIIAFFVGLLIVCGGIYLWQAQKNPLNFKSDDIGKYVLEMNKYETEKPNNFERAKFGNGNDIDVGSSIISHSVFVLTEQNWDTGNMEDVKIFYLEEREPPACAQEDVCLDSDKTTYYGPFQGKVLQLLQ